MSKFRLLSVAALSVAFLAPISMVEAAPARHTHVQTIAKTKKHHKKHKKHHKKHTKTTAALLRQA
jgi:hypothetical protein